MKNQAKNFFLGYWKYCTKIYEKQHKTTLRARSPSNNWEQHLWEQETLLEQEIQWRFITQREWFFQMPPWRYDALENKNNISTRLVTIDITQFCVSFSIYKKKDTDTFGSWYTHAQARTHCIKSERFTCSPSLAISAVSRPQDSEEYQFM